MSDLIKKLEEAGEGSFRPSASIPTCVVAIAAACLLTGCEVTSRPHTPDTDDLRYFRDERTGLCFAALSSATHSGYRVVSITHVPCGASVDDVPISDAPRSVGTERSEVNQTHENQS